MKGSLVVLLAVTAGGRVARKGGVASLEGPVALLAEVDTARLALDLVGGATAGRELAHQQYYYISHQICSPLSTLAPQISSGFVQIYHD